MNKQQRVLFIRKERLLELRGVGSGEEAQKARRVNIPERRDGASGGPVVGSTHFLRFSLSLFLGLSSIVMRTPVKKR